MKLTLQGRAAARKSEALKLRRAGLIPAVIYSKGSVGINVAVKADEFNAILRQLPKGRLPTLVFTLVDPEGREIKAIVKDIQYNIVSYEVTNLDFVELHDDRAVNVRVPIICQGVVDCPGIKLGGVLRQVLQHVPVRCLPGQIPECFALDVSSLGMRQSRRLADIAWPEGVRPRVALDAVAVTIVKR